MQRGLSYLDTITESETEIERLGDIVQVAILNLIQKLAKEACNSEKHTYNTVEQHALLLIK